MPFLPDGCSVVSASGVRRGDEVVVVDREGCVGTYEPPVPTAAGTVVPAVPTAVGCGTTEGVGTTDSVPAGMRLVAASCPGECSYARIVVPPTGTYTTVNASSVASA